MNTRKKQKAVCVSVLPRLAHVSVSFQSTHPCRAKFQVVFPPQAPSLLPGSLSLSQAVLAVLSCVNLGPGQGVQRGTRIGSPKGVCAELSSASESECVSRCVFLQSCD